MIWALMIFAGLVAGAYGWADDRWQITAFALCCIGTAGVVYTVARSVLF